MRPIGRLSCGRALGWTFEGGGRTRRRGGALPALGRRAGRRGCAFPLERLLPLGSRQIPCGRLRRAADWRGWRSPFKSSLRSRARRPFAALLAAKLLAARGFAGLVLDARAVAYGRPRGARGSGARFTTWAVILRR